eukprot:COSAG05_NODE_1923_length_3830_cov_4.180113_3_plen_126_part_00
MLRRLPKSGERSPRPFPNYLSRLLSPSTQWIQYDFNSPTVVSGYDIVTGEGECPVAWTVEVSSDGLNWETVDHREGETCHDGDSVTYKMESVATSSHYRWLITEGEGGNSNGVRIKEIRPLFCAC